MGLIIYWPLSIINRFLKMTSSKSFKSFFLIITTALSFFHILTQTLLLLCVLKCEENILHPLRPVCLSRVLRNLGREWYLF